MLGDNKSGQSYVVGFGDKYPCSRSIMLLRDAIMSITVPMNIIYGALVGDQRHRCSRSVYLGDSRSDYVRNECN
ncbi:glycoside hydrolase family 9 protein [Brucella sp. 09RB8471]|uniref:glycoside hydrolase family 9 protein n=1 Tax=Brucella sp. 09RB8471 TaxID=1149952 RepID=UPI0009727E43|nr:hypothetical protein BKD03_05940 [Brucella sp. 09RB8471]